MPNDATPALVQPRRPAPKTIIELFQREEETTRRLSAVATRHLPAERAAGLALSALRKTRHLKECTVQSFLGSLMAATALGLEPNTAKDHAWLIPYKRREARRDQNNRIVTDADGKWIFDEWYEAQFQIGYKGFLTLLYRSPLVASVKAESVYDVDRFVAIEGTNERLEFEKCLTKPRVREIPANGDQFNFSPGLVAAFCFVHLTRGQSFTVTPLEDLYRARSRSQAWTGARRAIEFAERDIADAQSDRAGQAAQRKLATALAAYRETPWVLWEAGMTAKTAIRQHVKQSSLDDDSDDGMKIGLAADMDALGDAGMIDMEALADPDRAQEIVRGNAEMARETDVADQERLEDVDSGSPAETDNATASKTETIEKSDKKSEPAPPADQKNKPLQRGMF